MRNSAKRGEPQIFLLCVTVWARAGDVVSHVPSPSPSPEASAENKSAPPWPRHIGRGVGAILFPQRKRDVVAVADADQAVQIIRNKIADLPEDVEDLGRVSPALVRALNLASGEFIRIGDNCNVSHPSFPHLRLISS
jgi:hypothetical protein